MNEPPHFDATLRSWLQRTAPPEAPDRLLAAALAQAAAEPQRRGWMASFVGGTRRRAVLRGAALTGVIVLAILTGLRLANLGLDVGGSPSPVPSASSMAEASVIPSEAASVICEAFADDGPMDKIAWQLNVSRYPDTWMDVLSDGANGLLALAERASGDERGDLMAIAAASEEVTTAWEEWTRYSPDEFHDLPQETKDALGAAVQDSEAALRDAEPAFYRKYYVERCGLDLDAPHFVDCGRLDQAACDQRVAELIAGQRQHWEETSHEDGLPPDLPVLYVEFAGPIYEEFGGTIDCISHTEIMWPGGGVIAESMCGGGPPLPTPTAVVGTPEVGVPYQVALHDCMFDFPLGDTWWRFVNAGPTPEPIIPDTVGTVHGVVTLTSPDTAILRPGDGSELMLIRVDEPIEGRCY